MQYKQSAIFCKFFCWVFSWFYYFSLFLAVKVRYDFHITTMFCSSLPPVVCRSAHVLFTLFVFAYA